MRSRVELKRAFLLDKIKVNYGCNVFILCELTIF